MKNIDFICGIVIFLLGLFLCLQSLGYPFGSVTSPGGGFVPLLASVLLMGLSGILIIQSFLEKDTEVPKDPFFPGKEAPRRVLIGIIGLLMFRYLLPVIGFVPSTFLFIFFLSKIVSRYGWLTSIFFAVVTALAAYYVFQVFLEIQMPQAVFRV